MEPVDFKFFQAFLSPKNITVNKVYFTRIKEGRTFFSLKLCFALSYMINLITMIYIACLFIPSNGQKSVPIQIRQVHSRKQI